MRRLAVAAMLWLAGCEAPPVSPGADARQNTRLGRIDGTVVVSGPDRGNVVVLLFAAERPPPPDGSGRPLAFTVLPEGTVFGGAPASATGPFVAPFTFSLVPPGAYLVRGFIDANRDFVPWFGVTGEVNAGDVGGAVVDPLTRAPLVVQVVTGPDGGALATTGVAVSFSPLAKVPADRPVFGSSPTAVTVGPTGARLDLTVAPIAGPVVVQPGPVFLAALVDANRDGVPDDANADGVPDLWPRVVVRKLAAPPAVEDDSSLLDENDLDRNGVLDTGPGFVDYEHVDPGSGAVIAPDGKPDAVALAAGFDVAALLPQLLDADGGVKLSPTPLTTLPLVIQPRAVDIADPRAPAVLRAVPRGRYAITVVQSTGQTWRVPNELAPERAPGFGFPAVDSQALVIRVE